MNERTERRILYLLCLAGASIALVALNGGLVQSDIKVIGVSLAIVGLMSVTGVAIWRSGFVPGEAASE